MNLTERVREALFELSLLNESPVSAGFDARVRGGESDHIPQPTDTALDYFVGRLERWCADAENRVEKERKGQADERGSVPELTSEQKRYYLLHSEEYEGVDYRRAGERLGLEPRRVYEMRKQVGLNPRSGRRQK